ncbi:MAG: hypothetical protein MUF22_02955 [Chitinispirillaceae bacterium]|jgi:hypothetical protein|nr:hypothetical protein [Chitinispirillaceae bacterium]
MKNSSFLTVLLFSGIIIGGNFITFNIVHIPNQMTFVIILTAIMFYPVMRLPLAGIYLMFIIMPLIPLVRRYFYLAYSRPKVDPLIVIGDIIMTIMVMGLFFTFREHMRSGTFRNRISFIVLCYFLLMTIRIFVYNELPLGVALMRYRFYGPQVLLFFVGMLYALEEAHMRKLWGITLLMGIAAVLYGINQFMFGYSEAEKLWFSSIDFTSMFINDLARPFSFFSSPASFADYMQVSLIAIIAFSAWSKISGKVTWLLMPIFWTGAVITSVRSNWIGMALTLFVWLFIVKIRGMKNRVVILVIMVALFITFDVLQNVVQTGLGVGRLVSVGGGSSQVSSNLDKLVTQRSQAINNPFQEHSMQTRIQLWTYIVQSSADPQHAMFGRGVGVLNADSLYLTYLSEFGYPGMLLIMAIIVMFIMGGFKILDRTRSPYALVIAKTVVTMDIVFAIISTTGSHISAFPGDTYFWFWNGVMMGLWTRIEKGTAKGEVHENFTYT